jgi:ABC-type sugar transport system substrate-binding protein
MSDSTPAQDAGRRELWQRPLDRRRLLAGGAGMLGAALAGGSLPLAAAARPLRAMNTKQIAFAQPDTAFAGYPLLLQGAKAVGSKRGYEILESHANSKLDAQVNELNTWIGEGIGGVIVLPLDNNAMLPLIKKAHAAGVKFLDYSDNALPGTDGWVIFDNLGGAHLVGTYAGHWVNTTLHGQAKVALLTHEIQKTGRDRIHGAVAALKKVSPKVQIVAQHEAVLAADALPVVQSMLQAHPDLNVIFCIADDGCLGAERAFMQTKPSKARQDTMFIAGWDGTVPVFKKILAGSTIRATGALDLIGIGGASISATANAIEHKSPTRVNYPYVLVDQSHPAVAKAFLKKYHAS